MAATAPGPKAFDAGVAQAVDQPGHQGCLGTDHDEIDRIVLGEGDLAVQVLGADRHAFRLARDSGVAGRAKQFLAQRRGGDLPTQGVLAPAAADDQNSHDWWRSPSRVPEPPLGPAPGFDSARLVA